MQTRVPGGRNSLAPARREAGRLAQLVRASALQAEGHPFEPDTAHQLIESWGQLAIDSMKGESA